MDMDHPSSGQHQQMCNNSVENMIACSNAQQDNKPKPLKCPRCDSANTKFCYYNNYSLSQPRYFCKSCRRYWTKGGTLRNVPVGGGCRKNKRSSSSSSKRAKVQAFTPNPNTLIGLTPMSYESNDLNLALARLQKGSFSYDDHDHSILGNHTNTNTSTPCDNIIGNLGMNPSNPGFLDALISGFFLGTHSNNNGMQNMYYGFGNGENMSEVDNGKNNGLGEMMVPYDPSQPLGIATTEALSVTTMKQSENKVLLGFPWKLNGGGDTNMAQPIESGRASWNNGFTPSWHGLVNSSPLM